MRTLCLSLCAWIISLPLSSTAQTVRVPIKLEQFGEIELGTNGWTVVVTNTYIVTNVVNVTNWFTLTNVPPRHVVNMPGVVLAPAGFKIDLSKTITAPTTFVLGTFAPDDDMLLFLSNPGSNTVTWPSNLKLPYGPLPTNAGLAVLWFKNVNGTVWASP